MPLFTRLRTSEDEASRKQPSYKWRRVLLKVSGEALAGDPTQNIDPEIATSIARAVASVTKLGVQVAIVVGGRNIFDGASRAERSGLHRSHADYIGMLATVMNAIFLQSKLESIHVPTRVLTALTMPQVAETYGLGRAVRHLEKGRVVIFAGGTGNALSTTDTAAAQRCVEIDAEVLLKATSAEGIFDDDPRSNSHGRLFRTLTYRDAKSKDPPVLDIAALTLCQENNIPVVVFNANTEDNIYQAIVGRAVGTLIGGTAYSTMA